MGQVVVDFFWPWLSPFHHPKIQRLAAKDPVVDWHCSFRTWRRMGYWCSGYCLHSDGSLNCFCLVGGHDSSCLTGMNRWRVVVGGLELELGFLVFFCFSWRVLPIGIVGQGALGVCHGWFVWTFRPGGVAGLPKGHSAKGGLEDYQPWHFNATQHLREVQGQKAEVQRRCKF